MSTARPGTRPVTTLWGRLFLEPAAHRLGPLVCEATTLTPMAITLLSCALAALSAALFASGHGAALVLGALVFQLSTLGDLLDGQVARLRPGSGSVLALVTDHALDPVRVSANVLALAWGRAQLDGGTAPLIWAGAFLTLHFLDWTLPKTIAKVRGAYRTLYEPRMDAVDAALDRYADATARVGLKAIWFGTHEREAVVLLVAPLTGAVTGGFAWGCALTAVFFVLRLRFDISLVKRELLTGSHEYLGDVENPWDSGEGPSVGEEPVIHEI